MNTKDKIFEFIERRFPPEKDCNWVTGNCYYFAVILREAFPGGRIVYEPIDGHFLYEIDGCLYDWFGRHDYYLENRDFINWEEYHNVDPLHYERILRDCIR